MGQEQKVLKVAFLRALRTAEFFAATHDREMLRLKGAVLRALLSHPVAPELATDFEFRQARRRFEALNLLERPSLTERETVEGLLRSELADARAAVCWPAQPAPVDVA